MNGFFTLPDSGAKKTIKDEDESEKSPTKT